MSEKTMQKKEDLLEDPEILALKCLLVDQLEKARKDQQKTKMAMAHELRTSRAYLDRVLDPHHTTVSLRIIIRAARVLGKQVNLTISDVTPA